MEEQRRQQLTYSPWMNQSHSSLNQMFTERKEVADTKKKNNLRKKYDLERRNMVSS